MFSPSSPSSGADVITKNISISVPVDFPTIYDAVASFSGKTIAENVIITINVAAGVITHTAPQDFSLLNVNLKKFNIIGAAPTDYVIGGAGYSMSNATGFGRWLDIPVANHSGISVGDYVLLMPNITGTSEAKAFVGIGKVVSFDNIGLSTVRVFVANRVTQVGSYVNGGTLRKLNSVLQFNTCSGLVFKNTAFSDFKNIAIVGNGDGTVSSGYAGIELSSGASLIQNLTDLNVGIMNFNGVGIYAHNSASVIAQVAICGCNLGFYGVYEATFIGAAYINGNASSGVAIAVNSNFDSSIDFSACGNSNYGTTVQFGSKLAAKASSIITRNGSTDIYSNYHSFQNVYTATYNTISPASGVVGNYNSINRG